MGINDLSPPKAVTVCFFNYTCQIATVLQWFDDWFAHRGKLGAGLGPTLQLPQASPS